MYEALLACPIKFTNAECALAEHQAEAGGELDHDSEDCEICLTIETQIEAGG